MSARISLIHATEVAIKPVQSAFEKLWPEAETFNILDDGLSHDLSVKGQIDEELYQRIEMLTLYAIECGSKGILFTCSAFGSAIERARQNKILPILKPNEAMFESALGLGSQIGMVATFEPSVSSMEQEFFELAKHRGGSSKLNTVLAAGAMRALKEGDEDLHNELVAKAALALEYCDVVMLAHFSTAKAYEKVAAAIPKARVLTSPNSAVAALRHAIAR